MQLSQQIASAVALHALGYHVAIEQKGVRVALVYAQTHASGKLEPGDVIVAANGKPVRSSLDLHEILARYKVGQVVSLTFLHRPPPNKQPPVGMSPS